MGRRLGELLVAEGRISEAVLARALELQNNQARGLRLGAILLRWGMIPEKTLLDSLARVHKCPAVDWATLSTASKEAVNLLSAAQSKRLAAVPYSVDKKSVSVAFANPADLTAIDEVGSITRRRVIVTVTPEIRLLQAQQRFYQRPLPRDVWNILQKIEEPSAARRPRPAPKLEARPKTAPVPRPARTTSDAPAEKIAPPPELVPPSLWIEANQESARELETCAFPVTESGEETVSIDSPVEDLVETAAAPAASSLLELDKGVREHEVPILRGQSTEIVPDFENSPLEELLGERLDPFADETPLTDFIEQALAFYSAQPAFRSALDALDEGAVEDLESEAEEASSPASTEPAPEAPSMAPSLDSTSPSLRRRHRSEPGPEVAV